MTLNQIQQIGITGAGLMGHGIAQVFASAGYDVFLFDKNHAKLSQSLEKIENNLKELVDFGIIAPKALSHCLDHIHLTKNLAPSFCSCQVVIEAIDENLERKQALFSELETVCRPETIFCSNTSSIPIADIGHDLKYKDRLLGTHFWNPSNIMPCVEVIKSGHTSARVFETMVALLERVGKTPVKVLKDVPGFLGNRLQLALLREALFIVEAGIAAPEDLDQVVRTGFGMRLPFAGLFELMDLTGHDVGYRVQNILFPELSCGKSAPDIMKRMIDRGDLGVKAGRGFYPWPEDKVKQRTRYRNKGLYSLIQLLKTLET